MRVLPALLVSMACFASMQTAAADSLTLVKPNSTTAPHVGVIFIQGTQIPSGAYAPLIRAIQEAAGADYSIFGAIPAYIGDIPEPLQLSSGIDNAKKALLSAGMDKSAPIIMAAHSLGSVFLQDYVFKSTDVVAQVLTGASLLRKYRNGSQATVYPVPTLTLDGTLDGLYRVTRQAETYYHQIQHPTNPDVPKKFPVVIYEGVSHMQFASGPPPSNVKNNDLKPEVAEEAAHAMMGTTIANWIRVRVGGSGIDTASAQQAIDTEVKTTGSLLQPIIDALDQEAYHHFSPACNSDYPMPYCPAYPRYPSGAQGTTPQVKCTCGTPWSAQVAQVTMAGDLPTGVSVESVDAIHSVSDVTPIHLPHIFQNCSSGSEDCHINSTTVTQQIYSSLDSFDTGFYYTTASELRVKLKSRQSMQLAAGVDPSKVNFTATDVVPSNCAEINQKAYEWALSHVSQTARDRFNSKGQPLVMGDDIFISNAGPVWIWNSLKYKESSDKSHVVVSAPCSHTPVDYSIKAAAGYHYCKLLSPARALEWIMIDGLRAKGGL